MNSTTRGLLGLGSVSANSKVFWPASANGIRRAEPFHERLDARVPATSGGRLALAVFPGIHNGLGLRSVERHGSDELKAHHLETLATGRGMASFALSESSSGSNPLNMRSRATRTATGWQVNAKKRWPGPPAPGTSKTATSGSTGIR
ncbi:MAG: hypothetical protein R3F19_24775 [Verrucomicrobiales bacterium]